MSNRIINCEFMKYVEHNFPRESFIAWPEDEEYFPEGQRVRRPFRRLNSVCIERMLSEGPITRKWKRRTTTFHSDTLAKQARHKLESRVTPISCQQSEHLTQNPIYLRQYHKNKQNISKNKCEANKTSQSVRQRKHKHTQKQELYTNCLLL